jgi:NAD(P)-dependent dehydrogenase (short-subunit alcohol dehydrogenase family)
MHSKQVALITGANQGIGLQIAKDLAAKDFTVLIGPDGPTGTFTHATMGTLPW